MTFVKPVINAIRILNHLSVTGQPETVTELARALQINTCVYRKFDSA
jgi:DNA-binding IclR family transcriptional regulator